MTKRNFMTPRPVPRCRRPGCDQPGMITAKGYRRLYCSVACQAIHLADHNRVRRAKRHATADGIVDLSTDALDLLLKRYDRLIERKRRAWRGGV